MENIIVDFVPQELLIIGVVLYVLGFIIKQSKVPDNFILLILLVAGVGFAVAKQGFNVDAVMYGIILTMTPVFAKNILKQAKEVVDNKDE